MASNDDSDDDSDDWGAEELDLSALNVKDDDKEDKKPNDNDDDDEYWDKAPSQPPPQEEEKQTKNNTQKTTTTTSKSKTNDDSHPMIIIDMTEISDGKIHNKHDRNSVNDSEAVSKLRKQIESKYETYAKDSSLLSSSVVIPCSSNVYRDALLRLRDEKPGHYFAPIFPPKKK